MGSLEKIKPDSDKLIKWLKEYPGPYIVSDKLDGSSGIDFIENVEHEQHKFYTRGNGYKGRDITPLLKYVSRTKLNKKELIDKMTVRGEIIISKVNFDLLNIDLEKHGEKKFENARNAANGLVNSKHISSITAKYADFIAHSIMYPRMNQEDQLKKLKACGYLIPEYRVIDKLTLDDLSKYLTERREKAPYEVDGIVVMDNSQVYDIEAGKDPKEGFAFKAVLTDQMAETTILDMEWNITKDGVYAPTAKIDPVKINGSNITSVTGNNAQFVVENGIGPGAIIQVILSGDIIPKIYKVLKRADKIKMPAGPYKWNDTHKQIIAQDVMGAQKDLMIAKEMEHFFDKLDIKYIGEGIITKLVDNNYKSVLDILSANKEDLSKIDGIGEKMIDKIFNNIAKAFQTVKLYTLMAASNLCGKALGEKKLKLIVDTYSDIMTKGWDRKEMIEKIIEIDGFSDKTATAFADNFPEFKIWFAKLEKIVDVKHLSNIPSIKVDKVDKNKKSGIFDGQSFVFTGTRNKALMTYVEENDGHISDSVSSKTNYVIYGADNPDIKKSKITKAIDYNKKGSSIQIMSDTEFIAKHGIKI